MLQRALFVPGGETGEDLTAATHRGGGGGKAPSVARLIEMFEREAAE